MRTRPLSTILLRAWQRAGNDAADLANIPAGTRTMMVAAANGRMDECWNWTDWPDLCRTEQRTVQGDATTGRHLPLSQTGKQTMGEIFRVWLQNPAIHPAPRQTPYVVGDERIIFPQGAPDDVWVYYRLPVQELAADDPAAQVPQVLARAIEFGLTADLLDEDGQLDKATLNEQRMDEELIRQRDRYTFQQNQTPRWQMQDGR